MAIAPNYPLLLWGAILERKSRLFQAFLTAIQSLSALRIHWFRERPSRSHSRRLLETSYATELRYVSRPREHCESSARGLRGNHTSGSEWLRGRSAIRETCRSGPP